MKKPIKVEQLLKGLRPDLRNYEVYPKLMFRQVISFDTLLSLYLGFHPDKFQEVSVFEEFQELALDAIFDGRFW